MNRLSRPVFVKGKKIANRKAPLMLSIDYLRYLLCDNNGFVHTELVLAQVQVGVEGITFAHARDQGQSRKIHTGSHEKNQILVTCFSKSSHLNKSEF